MNLPALHSGLVVLALALAGCATVRDTYDAVFGTRDTGVKPAQLIEFRPTALARVLWQGNVGSGGSSVFYPFHDAGSVFAAGKDGQLARYDSATGRQVWRVDTGQKLSGGVGAGGNLVLVGTAKGEVLAFDKSGGQLLWKAQVSSEILSPPQTADGVVVVRAGDGRVFGLDAQDGKRKWVYQRSTPALTVRSHSGVVIERGEVFSGFPGGKLVALNLQNGNLGWEATVSQPRGATELERISDITSLPVLDERQICAVAYQGRIACFDVFRGSLLWARDISSNAGLTVDRRNIYVSDEKGAVIALDKATGSSIWKQEKLFARKLSAPHVQGRFIAVGDYQGYIHFLSRDDGGFAARFATDNSPAIAQPVALGQGFLVQTANGGLYALTVQ